MDVCQVVLHVEDIVEDFAVLVHERYVLVIEILSEPAAGAVPLRLLLLVNAYYGVILQLPPESDDVGRDFG